MSFIKIAVKLRVTTGEENYFVSTYLLYLSFVPLHVVLSVIKNTSGSNFTP